LAAVSNKSNEGCLIRLPFFFLKKLGLVDSFSATASLPAFTRWTLFLAPKPVSTRCDVDGEDASTPKLQTFNYTGAVGESARPGHCSQLIKTQTHAYQSNSNHLGKESDQSIKLKASVTLRAH
jgi:hypothetical protein